MATARDVRTIAMRLPGVTAGKHSLDFAVLRGGKPKGFVWAWRERKDPKRARVPSSEVLAVRVAGGDEKAALLAGDPAVFFTEPHYDGYPAVLVRLRAVRRPALREIVVQAWRCMAGAPLVAAYDATPKRRR